MTRRVVSRIRAPIPAPNAPAVACRRRIRFTIGSSDPPPHNDRAWRGANAVRYPGVTRAVAIAVRSARDSVRSPATVAMNACAHAKHSARRMAGGGVGRDHVVVDVYHSRIFENVSTDCAASGCGGEQRLGWRAHCRCDHPCASLCSQAISTPADLGRPSACERELTIDRRRWTPFGDTAREVCHRLRYATDQVAMLRIRAQRTRAKTPHLVTCDAISVSGAVPCSTNSGQSPHRTCRCWVRPEQCSMPSTMNNRRKSGDVPSRFSRLLAPGCDRALT